MASTTMMIIQVSHGPQAAMYSNAV